MPRSRAAEVAATYQTRAHKYDNLRAAVVRILVGGARTLTPRFAALASHYLLEACFCRPGEGHDKGGVESRGKAVRQQALVPIPARSDARSHQRPPAGADGCAPRDQARCGRPTPLACASRRSSATSAWRRRRSRRRPRRSPRSRRARWSGSRARYHSVPSRWVGLDLVVRIGATTVTIIGREGTRILHPRRRFGQRSIDYRHYLSELARKPQAVRQVLPIFSVIWAARFRRFGMKLHGAHGPRDAARLFAKVLGQLDTYGAALVVPALTVALATGTPLLLALTPAPSALARVAPEAVPASLRDIDVISGCAADYDGWLVAVGA